MANNFLLLDKELEDCWYGTILYRDGNSALVGAFPSLEQANGYTEWCSKTNDDFYETIYLDKEEIRSKIYIMVDIRR